jgi:hypothetical protein
MHLPHGFPVGKNAPSKLRPKNNLPKGRGFKPMLFGKLVGFHSSTQPTDLSIIH